jgi:hypothetical protein
MTTGLCDAEIPRFRDIKKPAAGIGKGLKAAHSRTPRQFHEFASEQHELNPTNRG